MAVRALFLTLSLCASWVHASRIDFLAVEYPPFTTQTRSDFGIAFLFLQRYLSGKSDVEMRPVFLPPARLQRYLEAGQWCASFYPPPESNKNVEFIELRKQKLKIGLYHLNTDPLSEWKTLVELKGYKVALLRSNLESQFVQMFLEAGLEPVFVERVEQGVKMLEAGRVNAALGDEFLKSYLEDEFQRTLAIRISSTGLVSTQIGFYVNLECQHSEELTQ